MAGPAQHSDRILREARQSLTAQRAGGRRVASIGRGSAELKRRNLSTRIKLIVGSAIAIVLAAMVTGLIIDGIGIVGFMFSAMAIMCAIILFSSFPKVKVPERAALNTGDVRTMVARTELWLEAQRPALPAPAVELVDQLGVQLDALGLQLEGLDPLQPAAVEVRKLVGEHLPEMVSSYRRIPAHLRTEDRGGRTPDQQLADGLGKISAEIDQVTRQLAAGDLDKLAMRDRFLDYKYGGALEGPDTPREDKT